MSVQRLSRLKCVCVCLCVYTVLGVHFPTENANELDTIASTLKNLCPESSSA
jgi:hypothetical protein